MYALPRIFVRQNEDSDRLIIDSNMCIEIMTKYPSFWDTLQFTKKKRLVYIKNGYQQITGVSEDFHKLW